MAITILAATTAPITIGLQRSILSYPDVHPIGDGVGNASRLLDAFEKRPA